jgi:glycosyltransferase involved in cell wall biosynthesis
VVNRRLLIIADAFYPAELPPECATNTYLATSLGRRGWAVSVWAGRGATAPAQASNVRVIRSTERWGIGELLRVFVWLLLRRPRQLILMYHSWLYSSEAHINWVPFMARIAGVGCVTLFTNGLPPTRSRLQDRLLSACGWGEPLKRPIGPLGVSTQMVFYCDANRNALLGPDQITWDSRTEICTPPIALPVDTVTDTTAFRQSVGLTEDQFVVGFFGLIYPGKGLEWLLPAIAELIDRGLDIRLVLVGPHGGVTANEEWNSSCQSYETSLRKQAKEWGIDDKVVWAGSCDGLTAVAWISSWDVAVLPFEEGLSNQRSSFISCALIGVPVITTLTANTDTQLRELRKVIAFVEPRESNQIADAIYMLYKDAEMRRERGVMLRRFALKQYDNERFVDLFEPNTWTETPQESC